MISTKRLFRAFVYVLCITIVTGCWSRRELNDLAVAVAVGVDKRGKQILLTDQTLNPAAISRKDGGTSSNIAPVTLFQVKGNGFQEAARRMTTSSTRKIYVGQLQMLIFGEELAKEGLGKVLDHMTRDHEYRKDFFIVIARGAEAQDVLKEFTQLEKTPATKMKASLEVSSKVWGSTAAIKIDDLLSAIISKGREGVLSGIKMSGDPKFNNNKENVEKIASPHRLKYSGLAVFKKDKLLGWLNEKESIGYNYTQGKINSTSVLLSCPKDDKHITVELLSAKNETKVSMKHGIPVINLKIKAEGVLTDAQCGMDFTKPASIALLEQLTDSHIQDSISSAVKIMQTKYKSDIFGFGEEVERKHPKYWETVKTNWDHIFPTIQVHIQVESKIRKVFKTSKSFLERMEE